METLENTLSATIHGFSKVFLVIDALDECPSESGERKTLLDSLYRIHTARFGNLHLLCASRKVFDIQNSRLLSLPSRVAVDLSIYKDAVDKDIGLYIDKTLSSSDYDSWPVSTKAVAKTALIKKADGM